MPEPAADTAPTQRPILVEDGDGVRKITLNRPEARNALNTRCYQFLARALEEASGDPQIACVLVTAAGDAFTAGYDLRDDEFSLEEQWAAYESFIYGLEGFDKPAIAAVNGYAIGIGATMLGHFDVVIASVSARFRFPFASLALSPEAGSSFTLPAAVGTQMAAHALFTASWISAEEARDSGLIWKLVDDDELLRTAEQECKAIAGMPVDALVTAKRLLLANRLDAVREARRREEIEFRRMQSGPDHAEALAAFAERRPPNFKRGNPE